MFLCSSTRPCNDPCMANTPPTDATNNNDANDPMPFIRLATLTANVMEMLGLRAPAIRAEVPKVLNAGGRVGRSGLGFRSECSKEDV
jgi:hypothetical protein